MAPRMFFALWPPPQLAQAMARRADRLELDGRRVPETQLHLTLAFHGRCGPEQRRHLEALAAEIVLPRFELVLDRVDGFSRAGVVWLGPSRVPVALAALARLLALGGSRTVERSRDFRPHVTLARRSTPVQAASMPPLHWPVVDFALIESGRNGTPGGYRERARWPLETASV